MVNLKAVQTFTICFLVVTLLNAGKILAKPHSAPHQQETDNVFEPDTFMEDPQRPPSKSEETFSSHDSHTEQITAQGKTISEIKVNGTASHEDFTRVKETDNALGHREEKERHKYEYQENKAGLKKKSTNDGIGYTESTLDVDVDERITVNGTTVQQSLPDGSISTKNIHGEKTRIDASTGEMLQSTNNGDLNRTLISRIDDFNSYFIQQVDETTNRSLNMEQSKAQIEQSKDVLTRRDYKTKSLTTHLEQDEPELLSTADQTVAVWDAPKSERKNETIGVIYDNKLSTLNVNNTHNRFSHNRVYSAEKSTNSDVDDKDGMTAKVHSNLQQDVTEEHTETTSVTTITTTPKSGKKGLPLEVVLRTTGQVQEDLNAKEIFSQTTLGSSPQGSVEEAYKKSLQTNYVYNTSCSENTTTNETDCQQQSQLPAISQVGNEEVIQIVKKKSLEEPHSSLSFSENLTDSLSLDETPIG